MEQKSWLVKIGDFFFKYRNGLFPLIIVLFCLWRPPVDTYAGRHDLEQMKDMVAIGIMLLGLGLRAAVIGYKYIKRGGLNKKVYAENLVTDGFFATCRNPLYVGNLLMYVGMFLMHGDPLVMLFGMGLFLFIYIAIVAAEEYFLRGKFGAAYEAYCRDVPRWIPKFSRLRGATQGMKFNFGRVLAKDYTTIVNGLFSLMLIQCWEEIAHHEAVSWPVYIPIVAVMILLLVVVKSAKKRGLFTAI